MYQVIDHYQGSLSVVQLCRICQVSLSGFYAWKRRPPSRRALENQRLLVEIKAIFKRSWNAYGAYKIMKTLAVNDIVTSKHRVARLMKSAGLISVHRKKYKVCTTDSKHDHPIAKNVLARDFTTTGPNQKWVGDITYVRTDEGFLYVATIMDLYARKIIGLGCSDSLKTKVCEDALNMALNLRQGPKDLVHHTDRGCQYASVNYRKLLLDRQHTLSMSRKGNCWDNAVAESFFSLLKKECVYQATYKTRKEAKQDIENYIFNFYNQERIHSSLDYLSPADYEKKAA